LNTEGFLVLSYSNGQTNQFQQLALANVDNLSSLKPEGGNRFSQDGKAKLVVNTAGKMGLGTLQVSGVELSNVDLAREFSELIVVQRGYQASSQVISAANEMIQQLGEIRGRK
jgi:flagellar hook protein FlgE